MNRGFALLVAFGLALGNPIAPIRAAETPSAPVKIIFDTDMSSDVDDIGALSILNQLANRGECTMLACVANAHDPAKAIAASISVINTFYGHTTVPIGTYKGPGFGPAGSAYTSQLRDEFPHSAPPDDQESNAVDVYRQALAGAPDHSVTIVSIGYLVNLRDLLISQADASSPLTGAELVRAKVKKLVVMGGQYPASNPYWGEFNFSNFHSGPVTRTVVETWPTPIIFTGFEIGRGIITSRPLASVAGPNPVRRAFDLHDQLKGRPSWDETAVLAAVRPPDLYWNVVANGYCDVAPNGSNQWRDTPRGHSYLVAKMPDAELAAVIDGLMTAPPRVAK